MEEQSQTCEGPKTESELLNALKSMLNNNPLEMMASQNNFTKLWGKK